MALFLTPADKKKIQDLITEVLNLRVNDRWQQDDVHPQMSPEIHIAKPTSASGIPARSGTTPGEAECQIYKIVLGSSSNTITLVENPTSKIKAHTVFNVWSGNIPQEFTVVERDKYGRWLVHQPPAQNQPDPCRNLYAFYDMNESSGDAIDSGPRRLNLKDQFSNGSVPGKIGTARISGSGSHFVHDHQRGWSLQDGRFVDLWFSNTSGGPIVAKSNSKIPGSTDEWSLYLDPTTTPTHKIVFRMGDGSGGVHTIETDASGFNDGSFHNVAAGVDCDGNLFIYADGILKTASFSGKAPVNSSLGIGVMALSDASDIFSGGSVDLLGFWACGGQRKDLDYLFNEDNGRTWPFGDCCCAGKAHSDPLSEDRYSYSKVAAGETANIAANRMMIVHGSLAVDGSLELEGSLILET